MANTMMWQMSSDRALEFFERCIAFKAETEEDKTNILLLMAKEGKLQRVWSTGRNKEQVVKDISKEHRVLHLNPPEQKSISIDDEPRTCGECGGTGFSDELDINAGFCKPCKGSGFLREDE